MKRICSVSVCCVLLVSAGWAQVPAPSESEKLAAAFQKLMSGCRMVGAFTTVGEKKPKPPAEESYTIARVKQLGGDRWRFHAKIQYAEKKAVSLPIIVRVRWAGDTPMIQVTDLRIPGMGTFTARVLIFRNRYAGTWWAGDHGGHMFGRIERVPQEKKDPDPGKEPGGKSAGVAPGPGAGT